MTTQQTSRTIDKIEVDGMIATVLSSAINDEKSEKICATLGTFNKICLSLQEKNSSIARLRNMLGIKTEKQASTSGCRDDSNSRADQKKSPLQVQMKSRQMIWEMIHLKK